jgi:hypothetical protein
MKDFLPLQQESTPVAAAANRNQTNRLLNPSAEPTTTGLGFLFFQLNTPTFGTCTNST